MSSRFLYLSLIVLLSTASTAQASGVVPADFQGNWAHPDCGNYDEAVILTRFFSLKSTEEKTSFQAVRIQGKGDDYTVLEIDGHPHPALRTEDSLLKIGEMEGANPDAWPKTWDTLPLMGRNEYTGCPETPAVIPLPLTRIMAHIDALHESCAESITADCRKLLFSIVDTNSNGRISRIEIKKAGAMLETFVPLTGGAAISTIVLEAAYKRGVSDGSDLAKTLLTVRDTDESGDLDEKELTGFSSSTASPALQQMLINLGQSFPAFSR
jgi:hypothetical protein